MACHRFGYTLGLLLAFSVASPELAFAQSSRDRAAARSAAESGADAFEQGKFDQSLELFTRAEQLVHAPIHLLFIARSQDKLGKLVDARETYLKLVSEKLPANAPAVSKNAQKSAESELNAVEARLPFITIQVRGEDASQATVSMDGADLPSAMVGIPVPADPGTHVFSARSERAKSNEVTLKLDEGGKQNVELTLVATGAPPPETAAAATATPGTTTAPEAAQSAESSGSGQRTWGFVALGASAVVAGVGTYFLADSLSTRSDADALFAECDPGCTDEEEAEIHGIDDDANGSRNLAIASYVVAGAGIVTGIVLIATAGGSTTAASTLGPLKDVRVEGGLGFLGASGRF